MIAFWAILGLLLVIGARLAPSWSEPASIEGAAGLSAADASVDADELEAVVQEDAPGRSPGNGGGRPGRNATVDRKVFSEIFRPPIR